MRREDENVISYITDVADIVEDDLDGFFAGWIDRPTPRQHVRVLRGSDYVVCAVDEASDQVVGFVTAVSDSVLSAYIPFLEVRADYRGRGIGSELLRRLLGRLQHFRMVDVVCDEEVMPFYRKHGFRPYSAMIIRRVPVDDARVR